jgi:hypothetical protein
MLAHGFIDTQIALRYGSGCNKNAKFKMLKLWWLAPDFLRDPHEMDHLACSGRLKPIFDGAEGRA